MNPVPKKSVPGNGGTYTPGYAGAKRAMFFAGLVVCCTGLYQLWFPLRLVIFGHRSQATVIRVIKEKPGLPAQVFTDPAQLRDGLESRDRSYVFWNEFRFPTDDGQLVEIRPDVGSQLRPLYSLTDADGLPVTDLILYDRDQPRHAIFPLIVSTWLVPAVLVLIGGGAMIIAAFLFFSADRPIELPSIPSAGGESGAS